MDIKPTNPMTYKPTDLKIAFLGTPRLAQIVLENLINSDFKPSLVITGEDKKTGRGQKSIPTPVKQTAIINKIETSHQLPATSNQHDLAVLVAFGKIIPREILEKPKYGFINVHPSLLPKYRGPSPIQSAILNGDKITGATIIKLEEEVDHGPILAQKEIEIEENDTHESLIEKTGTIGANLLVTALADYLSGKLKPKEQNHQKATFTKKITKADGQIDLDNPPSKEKLDRMIRAFYPWPTVWTRLKTQNSELRTIKFLPRNLIQMEGKKPMTQEEFFNGFPNLKPILSKVKL